MESYSNSSARVPESSGNREDRLQRRRERERARHASETAEQREERLRVRRARDRARRAAQTAEQRDARLRQIRNNRRQSLATESEEERAVRLQQMRDRLASETEEERAARLLRMSANQRHSIGKEFGVMASRQVIKTKYKRGKGPGKARRGKPTTVPSRKDQQDAASKVILHVATVGQGTAILIECQDTKNEGKFFLYDGGRRISSDKLLKTIETKCDYNLNGIVVSHTDEDHVGGVVRLLEVLAEKSKPCPAILLTTAFPQNLDTNKPKKHIEILLAYLKDEEVVQGPEDEEMVPCEFLHKSFYCNFHRHAPGLLFTQNMMENDDGSDEPMEDEDETMDEETPSPNDSSIILQVKPTNGSNKIDVCLTGDAPGHRIAPCVKDKNVYAFQVPHHGSRHNSKLLTNNKVSYDPQLVKMLTGYKILTGDYSTINKAKKPINKVKKPINKAKKPVKMTMDMEKLGKGLLRKASTLQLSQDGLSQSIAARKLLEVYHKTESSQKAEIEESCKKYFESWHTDIDCKRFYDCVQASTYIITCGKNYYGHPHPEVLNGIALAAVQKRKKCQIVITNLSTKDHWRNEDLWRFSGVFFEKGTHEMVRVWYLDDDNNCPPCVTINPLNFKPQQGMKELRFQRSEQSYKESVRILDSPRVLLNPQNAHQPEAMGDPDLQEYLNIIGHKGDITFFTLLQYILGFSIANQLTRTLMEGLEVNYWLILHTWKVSKHSSFFLSATGVAVLSGEVHLVVPEDAPLVDEKRVKAVTVHINKPRTSKLDVRVDLEAESRLSKWKLLSDNLDFRGNCGLPPAEYLAAMGVDSKSCVTMASDLAVGEVLSLLLNSIRANAVVRGFPDFFSTSLINYKIDPIQTIIDFQQFQQSNHVTEAHIVAKIPNGEASCITVADSLHLQVHRALLHLYPSYDKSEQLVGLSGEFTLNNHCMTMKATPNYYGDPDMEFTLTDALTVSEVLQLFGIKSRLTSTELQVPFTQQKLQMQNKFSAGFTIQQPFLLVPRVSSIFFDVEWFASFPSFWPECIKIIKKASLRLSLVFPLESDIMVGLKASFICELPIATEEKNIILDCSFAATPILSKENQYIYFFSLKPSQRPYEEVESMQGAPILDVITALNDNAGKSLRTVFSHTWPELVNAIELREISFKLQSSGSVEGFKLDVHLYNQLELITGKLALSNARLLANYSPDYVQLECEGELTFLQQYQTFILFQLPTPELSGELMFENEDTDFTLMKFVSGMFGLEDSLSSVPVLSDLLSVSINSVHMIFECQESKKTITHADVTLTKEELFLGSIRICNIEITVAFDHSSSGYTYDFSLSGFIGDVMYAQLQYSESTSTLRGDIILASFKEIDGALALKELNIDHSLFSSISPLFDDTHGATAQLDVTIQITKRPIRLDLVYLALNLTNIVQLNNFAINQLWFEYAMSPIDNSKSFKFFGVLCKLGTQESAALKFTCDQAAITAEIVSGDTNSSSGGLLKLSSLLELIQCGKPDIPQLSTPTDFFDLELKTGSISFKPKPIKVSAFQVSVVSHGELCLIREPRFVVSDLKLETDWKEGDKVNGILRARFHFSKTSIDLVCKKNTSDILFTAQMQPEEQMNTGTEIQHIGQNTEFSGLIPSGVLDSQATPLAVAINITREQFLFVMGITKFGSGVLFAGKSGPARKFGLALAISLQDGFQFKCLSQKLSFIDNFITIRKANLAVSSLHDVKISEFCDNISKLMQEFPECESPFSNLPVSSSDTNQQILSKGASIFAELDINQQPEDSVWKNIIQIQNNPTGFPDLLLKASIEKRNSTSDGYNINVEASIQELTLLQPLKFKNIHLLYHLSEKEHCLKLSGTLYFDFNSKSLEFDGSMTVTKSDVRFEVSKVSKSPFASPLGMDITLTRLDLKVDFDLKGSLPLIAIMGSINFGHYVDLAGMVIMKGLFPKVVVIDITSELSITSLLGCVGTTKPDTLVDLKLMNGHFHYATQDTCLEQWMVSKQFHTYPPIVTRNDDGSVKYKEGIHAKCDVQIFFEILTFDIRLDITDNFSSYEISGRPHSKIDLGWVKITDPEFNEGPVLSYTKSKYNPGKLEISVGLEILDEPWFLGSLWYVSGQEWLNGQVQCQKTFLWMEKPTIEFKIIGEIPFFVILDFRFGKNGGSSIFNLAKMLERFFKWLMWLVQKVYRQEFNLNLRTATNQDPEYSVVFILSGTYTVVFFDKVTVPIALPELIVKVPKGFTLRKLPNLIIQTLIDAGKNIVTLVVNYIKSRGLLGILKDLAHLAVYAVKKAVTIVATGVKTVVKAIGSAVVSGAKYVAKKISGFFSWIFGSIKIIDAETKEVIAEIMGGREGEPLYNEQGVVPLLAPLVGIHGIHQHGKHVHKSGKAAVNLPSHLRDDSETEETGEERKTTLKALKTKHNELDSHLEKIAFLMLEIQDIELSCPPITNILSVKWAMDPAVMEVDKGDFDYHIKVVASTLASGVGMVSLKHHTLFDGKVDHSVVDRVPFTLIVDDKILPNAYQVTVNIQASIIMTVKAHNITEGVTVEGEWKHKEIFLKDPSLQAPSSVTIQFDKSLQCITGSLATVSGAQAYIVQLVDAHKPCKVIDEVIVQNSTNYPTLEYTFDLSQVSKSTSNIYTVRAQSVGSNASISEFTLCEKKCEQLASPMDVHLLLSHTNGDSVKVCWDIPPNSSQLGHFSLQLYAGLSGSGMQEIIRDPKIAANDSTTYSHNITLSEIAKGLQCKNITPSTDSDILLQCHISAHGKEDLLPSIPACSHEYCLLRPPTSVQCFYSSVTKSLYIGWMHVSHAFSYKIQLVNVATGEVALEFIYHYSAFSSKEHDCECVLGDDDLRAAAFNSNVTYRVQVFTLGHGEDYLGSLEPCASTTLLQTPTEEQMKDGILFKMLGKTQDCVALNPVKALQMQYTPGKMDDMKSICLSWQPPQFGAHLYTVFVSSVKKEVTSKTEVHLSPVDLGIQAAGKYTVSVIPDSDTQSECTFEFSVSELFTDFHVTDPTATSLSVKYDIIPDLPEDMKCYLIVENESAHVSHSLHLESTAKAITLHRIHPETTYNLYALAFSPDCTKWAIPKTAKTASLPAPKEMDLLGKNLLDDSSGADMTMGAFICKQVGTTSSSNTEDTWSIEPWTLQSNCDPPPLGLPTMYSTAKNDSVMRTQVVDLSQHEFSSAFLDEHQPDIRVQSWVCAPEVAASPTYYKMEVKLLSEDKEVLATLHKGPVRLHPTGRWKAIELTLHDYGPHLRYIEFADGGSSENNSTTRVAATTVRLGHPPGSCIEIFSLPHRDSFSSKRRTCLVQLSLPDVHTHFKKWKIEYSEANPESGEAFPAQPQDFYVQIAAKKIHLISLKIPIAAVRMRIFALGRGDTQRKLGEAFLPPLENAHIFERNLLTADMLEPQLPLCGVTMDAVIPSRVWADFLKREKPHWRLVHWTQGKQLGFNPPPCHSNFVVQKHTKCEDIQRVAKIDLWALGFSPTYLAERHPEFLVQIQYAVCKDQARFRQKLQLMSIDKYGSESIIAGTISGSDRHHGSWQKLSFHATSQHKKIKRYLIIYDKGHRCVTACTEVKPIRSTTPMIYLAKLQSHTVKLQVLDIQTIMHAIAEQTSPNLLVEYRVLCDSEPYGSWSEHYFGSPLELFSGIIVSNLMPSTMYEFAVTLTDSQKQEKYFSATTSGRTLPAPISNSGLGEYQ